MNRSPSAFFSYDTFVDSHDDGRLTDLCQSLEREVNNLSGGANYFSIFQDREDISWGQQWQERIADGLDNSTILIVIVTPGYLRREMCRSELEMFLAKEERIGYNDLILPVMYIETPDAVARTRKRPDPLAQALDSRQFYDWSELRFAGLDTQKLRKSVGRMALRICDILFSISREFADDPDLKLYEETKSFSNHYTVQGKRRRKSRKKKK